MGNDPNVLIQFLENVTGVHWLILGFALLVAEIASGTSYILWPAVAALFVGLVKLVIPIDWEMQLVLFALATTALLYIGHKYIRPRVKGGEPSDLNDRARSMRGMRVKAVADFDTGRGRVHVGDSQWRASMDVGNAKAGDELRVLSVKGTTLTVEPI
ncbi:MAG: NfeD family protein [Robiginitomaculum sp.]|nr:NfeD family protein [Robiginitomaculum sp.]